MVKRPQTISKPFQIPKGQFSQGQWKRSNWTQGWAWWPGQQRWHRHRKQFVLFYFCFCFVLLGKRLILPWSWWPFHSLMFLWESLAWSGQTLENWQCQAWHQRVTPRLIDLFLCSNRPWEGDSTFSSVYRFPSCQAHKSFLSPAYQTFNCLYVYIFFIVLLLFSLSNFFLS